MTFIRFRVTSRPLGNVEHYTERCPTQLVVGSSVKVLLQEYQKQKEQE